MNPIHRMEEQIYLDNAATTRVLPEVVALMQRALQDEYGNPSSPHQKGIEAETTVRRARERIAQSIGVDADEIIFTSGGTEANNFAVKGVGIQYVRRGGEILYSAIEHPSVIEAAKRLAGDKLRVRAIPVTPQGTLDLQALESMCSEETRLIAIMAVNNETGVIQPIEEAIRIARRANPDVIVHVDGVQALGKIPVKPRLWGVDTLALSAHKIHGPKGVGALYVRKGLSITPLLDGGGQERGLRSGTENVPGIVGMGEAVRFAESMLQEHADRIRQLNERMRKALEAEISPISWNSAPGAMSVPHILNVAIPGIRGEVLVRSLGSRGVYVSTGSACSTRKNASSHVLTAMGLHQEDIDGSLRISLSAFTTEEEIDLAVKKIAEAVGELKAWL